MTARHDPNSADYRLQIVSNTGDLYHSSPGSDGLKRDLGVDGLVEELYGSGLYFYYAPADGSLVCYFQGIRNVSEQLYVLYRGAPGRDFFEKFWRRFERELRGSNIDVNTQASGSHEVFRNLRSGTRSTPEFSMSELLELKRNPETPAPVTLGAPDYESAVGVVNWILGETAADLDLAIGGLGWVDDHLSTDVLVQPRGSDGVGAPIEETREHLDRIDLTNRIEETRETVAAATESVSRDDGSLDALAKRLNDAGLRERGLVVFAEAGRDRFASYRTDAAVASFALGLLGALTLAVQLDALGPIVDVLTADYRVEFVGPTSGWVVVLSSAILIGANLVGIVDAERFLGSGGDGPPDPRGSGIDDSHVRDIVSQLAEIATHDRTGTGTGTFGEFEQIAADRIFADCGLDVRTAETVENARRRQMLVGAGVGLLGAIAVAAVFGLVAVVLQRYQTAVMESVLLLGVAGGVGVGYRSARFLASRLVGTLSGVPGPTLSTVGRTWLPFVVGFPLIVDTASRFWLSASAPEDVLFATGVGCLQYGDLVGWAVLAVGLAVGFAGFEFRRTGEYRLFGPPLGALAGAVVLVQTGLPFPGVGVVAGAAVGGVLLGGVVWVVIALVGAPATWLATRGSTAVLILVAIALLFRTHISPGLAAVSSTAPLRTLADLAGLVLLSVGGFFVREPAQLTVFILGPSRSNPYLPLLHGMSSERGTANPKLTAMAHRFPDQTDPLSLYETNPNADLQTDVFLLQLDLAANARDIRLRTTVHEPGLIDGEFADRVERIRRNGRTQRDSERLDADEVSKGWFSSADRTERQHALVYEILDSDVVVLTFPVDTVRRVMAQNPNDSPERSEVTGYLEAYETILGTLPEDRCLVYGMGTDLLQTIDSYAQLEEHPLSGSPEVWEDFRTSITGEMDKHLDLEGGLEAHLDDEDSALYPIWISGSEIRGADRFLQDVDPSRER